MAPAAPEEVKPIEGIPGSIPQSEAVPSAPPVPGQTGLGIPETEDITLVPTVPVITSDHGKTVGSNLGSETFDFSFKTPELNDAGKISGPSLLGFGHSRATLTE